MPGHGELLFLPCFIASWTWVVLSVMLCNCSLYLDLSVDLLQYLCL